MKYIKIDLDEEEFAVLEKRKEQADAKSWKEFILSLKPKK